MKKKNAADTVKEEEVCTKETASEGQVSTPEEKNESQDAHVKYKVNFQYGLNLRKQPGKQSPILKVLPNGAEVVSDGCMEEAGGIQWLSVEGGWVDPTYLIPVDVED